jgi:cysteine desulfurase / selenocysteine lyase
MLTTNLERGPSLFDPLRLRSEFPIFSQENPVAYLDNAASAQKPQAVIDAMTGAMTRHYANVHRGLHRWANQTTQDYEAARGKVARFLNMPGDQDVVWTRGSTEALNILAHGLGVSLRAGDEVILSLTEHHANIVPWHMLREARGIVIRWVAPQGDGTVTCDAVEGWMNDRTRIVSITHQSNVLGVLNDVAPICALARAAGAVSIIDGSQSAVHLPKVDVQGLGCDAYVFTGHKLYGPTGIGVLAARAAWLDELPPLMGGGEMIDRVSTDLVTYARAPGRFEAGTPAIVEAIGLGAAVDWICAQDRSAIATHEASLGDRVREGLSAMAGVKVFGAKGSAIVSFAADFAHAHDLAQVLDHYGVAVRAGAHCAEPLMHHLGVSATARASVAAYNTEDDVDRLIAALHRARKMFE